MVTTPSFRFHPLLAVFCAAPLLGFAADKVDFNRDVRPILSENCFACHGPDEKTLKGKLRLDVRELALLPAKSGAAAIVPGDPAKSELLARVTATDADDRMPPEKLGKKLTVKQVETLKTWIQQGAEYSAHWAFIPPKAEALPAGTKNGIDHFVEARLRQEGLSFSPEADRAALLRRVTLDLTGLPPTPQALDAFLANTAPDAYEKAVDQLLASPHYGERMALDWLDAARFADTHGYHIDSGRDMTRWREWVIDAFNNNQRFDQFTIDQLAGDLLPNPSDEQRIASGFNRNHMINFEGGAIEEEYHTAYVMDRVNTTSTVWLGLTMGCAQCHDHKYDPLTMKDFYSFYAFFNSVPESGLDGSKGNAKPFIASPRKDQLAAKAKLQAELDAAMRPPPNFDLAAEQAKWEAAIASNPPTWKVLRGGKFTSEGGATLTEQSDGSILATGKNPGTETYHFTAKWTGALAGLRIEALTDPSMVGNGPGRAHNGNFVCTDISATLNGKPVKISQATADYSQEDFAAANAIDGDKQTGWAVEGHNRHENRSLWLKLEEVLESAQETEISVKMVFASQFGQHSIGRFRIAATADVALAAGKNGLPEEMAAIIKTEVARRSTEQKKRLADYFREQVVHRSATTNEKIAALTEQLKKLEAGFTSTMVMADQPNIRKTFILERGEYDKKGAEVSADTPAALPPMRGEWPKNRLGLAQWLVSGENPLTSRVIVNRFWQMYFGHGIVKSAENFGSQADWPSHPELLDWLALEFVRTGWDVKAMQRLIVTSRTYKQSAAAPRENYRRDPENRLYSRGPRVRLQAEFIRDLALSTSGLLNPEIGGASVNPYQPAGLWEELMFREDNDKWSAQKFVQSTGADLYKRGMYTFWKRTSPPANLGTLDAPDREVCTVSRARTNTPLQALCLMNDPTFVEASRKLAERILTEAKDDTARLQLLFKIVLARPAQEKEIAVLTALRQKELATFTSAGDRAKALLKVGESPAASHLGEAELAAWAMVCSTVLNLDEAITK